MLYLIFRKADCRDLWKVLPNETGRWQAYSDLQDQRPNITNKMDSWLIESYFWSILFYIGWPHLRYALMWLRDAVMSYAVSRHLTL